MNVILKFPCVTQFVNFIATIKHSIECIDKPAFTLTGQFSEMEVEEASKIFNAVVSPVVTRNTQL